MELEKIVEEQAEIIAQLEKTISVYNKNNDESGKESLLNLQEELFAMHTKMVSLMRENEVLVDQNNALMEQIANLNSDIDLLKKEKEALERNNNELYNNSRKYQNKFETIINSKSWRLTQPLRTILWRVRKNDKIEGQIENIYA